MSTQAETQPTPAEPTRILRTFRLCDSRGQLIASVSLDASVEIDPEPGITAEDALRRLQAGFRLTFERIRKGKEAEGMYQSDGEPKQEKRKGRVLTDEHKRRMQEGRRAAKGEEEEWLQAVEEAVDRRQTEIEETGRLLLTGMSESEWQGKAAIMARMDPVSDADWGAAINWLLESGKIEKQGQKGGSQYRKAV